MRFKSMKNTTKEVANNPMSFLKDGQNELVNSSELPLKANMFKSDFEKLGIKFEQDGEFGKPFAKSIYEKLGIKVGEKSDDLFVYVQLPEGWKLKSTDHSMWNKLVDAQDRERGSIFYKAAFYDREAFFNLNRRYSYETYTPVDKDGNIVDWENHTHRATFITDGGKPVHFIAQREKDSDYSLSEEHGVLAKAWLNENYPEWENSFAYWEA